MSIKFEKDYSFSEPYWFSGIYKISCYTWHKGSSCKPYYHVYYLLGKQWGDYVGGKSAQYDKRLTFNQCVMLCKEHAKTHAPTKQQLKQTVIARASFCNRESA